MRTLLKLDLLRIKCLTFNEFFFLKFGNEESFQKTNEVIEKAYQEKQTKVLDILKKDYFNQVREIMPYPYIVELKKKWLEKTGEELDSFQKIIDKKIQKIEKRGIRTIEEYQIIHNETESIWEDNSQKEKLATLNNLLNKWNIDEANRLNSTN